MNQILSKIFNILTKILAILNINVLFDTSSEKINPLAKDKEFNYYYKLARERTLIDKKRLYFIYQSIVSTSKLDGDIAELGVYKGGSAKLISQHAFKLSPQKKIYLLDTFEGLPAPTEGIDTHKEKDFVDTDIKSVKEFLKDSNNVLLLKGLFSNTLPNLKDKKFSFVHIDADLYKSVMECLEFFYHRVVKGGIIISDDYGFLSCPGAKKAVDEFFKDKIETPIYLLTGQCLIQKINNT